MVLNPISDMTHGLVVGSNVVEFQVDEALRPAKRLKTFESTDGEDSRDASDDENGRRSSRIGQGEIPDSDAESDVEDTGEISYQHPTDLESVLPPVKTDKEAIEEYEAMRMIDRDFAGELKDRKSWVKGKTSIYLDAFNLALETVLDDERHLFDEKEMKIFEQWRELEYEAQYL
jgi:fanconi-associated nuclease 1